MCHNHEFFVNTYQRRGEIKTRYLTHTGRDNIQDALVEKVYTWTATTQPHFVFCEETNGCQEAQILFVTSRHKVTVVQFWFGA